MKDQGGEVIDAKKASSIDWFPHAIISFMLLLDLEGEKKARIGFKLI